MNMLLLAKSAHKRQNEVKSTALSFRLKQQTTVYRTLTFREGFGEVLLLYSACSTSIWLAFLEAFHLFSENISRGMLLLNYSLLNPSLSLMRWLSQSHRTLVR